MIYSFSKFFSVLFLLVQKKYPKRTHPDKVLETHAVFLELRPGT